MQGYWIETEYFAVYMGEFTPEQYALFLKWCLDQTKDAQERSHPDIFPALVVSDCTLDWKLAESEARKVRSKAKSKANKDAKFPFRMETARIFWRKVKQCHAAVVDEYPSCGTFVKIIPENATKDTLKKVQPSSFINKEERYEEVKVQGDASLKKSAEKADWDLLAIFGRLAKAACDGRRKSDMQGRPSLADKKSGIEPIEEANDRTAIVSACA